MENKIDRRIKYVIVLDTETAPMDKDAQGVDPYNMLVYDVVFTCLCQIYWDSCVILLVHCGCVLILYLLVLC